MIANKKSNTDTIVTPNGYRNFADEPLGFRVDAYKEKCKVTQAYASNLRAVEELERDFHLQGFETETFWTRVDTTD